MVHFNWLQLLPFVDHHYIHVWTAIAVGLLLIVLSFAGRLALGTGETAVAPSGRFSMKGILEAILEFIVGLSDLVIGEQGRKFVPMFASIFFFILTMICPFSVNLYALFSKFEIKVIDGNFRKYL